MNMDPEIIGDLLEMKKQIRILLVITEGTIDDAIMSLPNVSPGYLRKLRRRREKLIALLESIDQKLATIGYDANGG